MEKKIFVFGLGINDTDINGALTTVSDAFKDHRQLSVYTPNLEIINACTKNKYLKELINSGDLLLPDGAGLLLISRMLGKRIGATVAGIDFGYSLLIFAAKHHKKVFLLGGKEGVARRAARMLKKDIEGLDICGTCNGYDKRSEASEMIVKSRADIVFVCMGFPRQENWVAKNRSKLNSVCVFACLGGAIDIWSGDLKRAPRFIRSLRAEWLFRIIHEPSRLPRFLRSTRIIFKALRQRAKNNSRHFENIGLKIKEAAYIQTERN